MLLKDFAAKIAKESHTDAIALCESVSNIPEDDETYAEAWDFDEIDFSDSLDCLEETLHILDELLDDEDIHDIPIRLRAALMGRRKKIWKFLDKFVVLEGEGAT